MPHPCWYLHDQPYTQDWVPAYNKNPGHGHLRGVGPAPRLPQGCWRAVVSFFACARRTSSKLMFAQLPNGASAERLERFRCSWGGAVTESMAQVLGRRGTSYKSRPPPEEPARGNSSNYWAYWPKPNSGLPLGCVLSYELI